MTTPTAPEAQSKISAADVVAWLRSFVPAEHEGRISVGCCTAYYKPFFAQYSNADSLLIYAPNRFADTPEEAVAMAVEDAEKDTPERIVSEKRDQIAKLQAELAAIEKGAA